MNTIHIPDSLPPWIKEHAELYLRDGKAAHLWDASLAGGEGMLTTLLLTTTGRKSGKPLIIPLIYRPASDGGYCVIASKGGAPAHPAWYLNLETEPNARIKVADDEYSVVARTAVEEERQELWNAMADYFPPFNEYQTKTERLIPVVVLNSV